MQISEKKSEFISVIRLINAKHLLKTLLKIQNDENIRVVVMILDFEKIENNEFTDEIFLETIKFLPVPIIAAVKGIVPKNAFSLIENSHLCIAAGSTVFENEIDIKEALNIGLINKIISTENLEMEAFTLAETISKLAPLAIRTCIKAVNQSLEMNLKDGLKLETELFSQIFSTEDMREGTRAFLEKRKPFFQGK